MAGNSHKAFGDQRRDIVLYKIAYQKTHTGVVEGTWEAMVKMLGKKKQKTKNHAGELPEKSENGWGWVADIDRYHPWVSREATFDEAIQKIP